MAPRLNTQAVAWHALSADEVDQHPLSAGAVADVAGRARHARGAARVTMLQLIFTYAPFMGALFDTRPVDFLHGAEIIAIGVGPFAILEVEKLVLRRASGGATGAMSSGRAAGRGTNVEEDRE